MPAAMPPPTPGLHPDRGRHWAADSSTTSATGGEARTFLPSQLSPDFADGLHTSWELDGDLVDTSADGSCLLVAPELGGGEAVLYDISGDHPAELWRGECPVAGLGIGGIEINAGGGFWGNDVVCGTGDDPSAPTAHVLVDGSTGQESALDWAPQGGTYLGDACELALFGDESTESPQVIAYKRDRTQAWSAAGGPGAVTFRGTSLVAVPAGAEVSSDPIAHHLLEGCTGDVVDDSGGIPQALEDGDAAVWSTQDGGESGTVTVYAADTGQVLWTENNVGGFALQAPVSADELHGALAEMQTGKNVLNIVGEGARISILKWNDDPSTDGTGGYDPTVTLDGVPLAAPGPNRLGALEENAFSPYAIVFDGGGKALVSWDSRVGSTDPRTPVVRTYDARGGENLSGVSVGSYATLHPIRENLMIAESLESHRIIGYAPGTPDCGNRFCEDE